MRMTHWMAVGVFMLMGCGQEAMAGGTPDWNPREVPETRVIELAQGEKCERCWHVSVEVGANAEHPTLCPRCISNLFGLGETRQFA